MKFQLISLNDEVIKFEDFNKLMWNLQKETQILSNKIIQLMWENMNWEQEVKKYSGNYPTKDDTQNKYGYKNINSYIYNELKQECSLLNTANLSTTLNNVYGKFKNEKIEYLKGNISIPSFKKDIPIDLHNKSIKLEYNEDTKEWIMYLSLLSNSEKKQYDLKKGQLKFKLLVKDNTQRSILEKCYDGIYKICASKITYNKKKWFLGLVYNFETIKKELDEDKICGVDLGVVYPAYMSTNWNYARYKIEGGKIESFRNQVEKRKKQLLRESKYCGDGRIGHGIKTRIKPIEVTSHKIANFRDMVNHTYSKVIVDFAYKNQCGTIQMENLKGISQDSTFLM